MHIYKTIKYSCPLVMVATDDELNPHFALKQRKMVPSAGCPCECCGGEYTANADFNLFCALIVFILI